MDEQDQVSHKINIFLLICFTHSLHFLSCDVSLPSVTALFQPMQAGGVCDCGAALVLRQVFEAGLRFMLVQCLDAMCDSFRVPQSQEGFGNWPDVG